MQLNLYKSDYFTVTTAGTTAVTFLSYVNVRANEVLVTIDRTGDSAALRDLNAEFRCSKPFLRMNHYKLQLSICYNFRS